MNIVINDHSDAFSWATALWYWCTHNYSKFDAKYVAFCKISDEYGLKNIPDIDFDNNTCEDYEIDVMNYHEINEDNWGDIFNTFCDYMDNEWDADN